LLLRDNDLLEFAKQTVLSLITHRECDQAADDPRKGQSKCELKVER